MRSVVRFRTTSAVVKVILTQEYDDSGWFWIDPINSLLEQNSSRLSNIGKAYNKPYHLDMYKPKHLP